MSLLALDTAGHACSLALVDPSGYPIFQKTLWMNRGHAAVLASLVREALAKPHPAISGLAVTRGPGGFTGLRTGLAYARAFGLARAVPVYGYDAFAALRLSVGPSCPCLIDTRRGDFFYDGPTAAALQLRTLAQGELGLTAQLPNRGCPLAGSIWRTEAMVAWRQGPPLKPGWIEPCPVALARAALAKLRRGLPAEPDHLKPLYMREPSVG